MPLWLLSGFLGIRKALAAVFGLVLRYPWQAACLALVLFAGWQTHSLHRAHAALSACEKGRKDDRASYVAAQQEALRKAVAAKEAQEAHYKELANEVDRNADKATADARTAAQRYIDSHRVRRESPSSPGGRSTPASQDHSAVSPAAGNTVPELDGGSGIVVSERDIRVCTENTVKAQAGHEWALSLSAQPKVP